MDRNFVRFLISDGVIKPPADKRVWGRVSGDYEQYLRDQRGLSERTMMADRFLTFRFGDEIVA